MTEENRAELEARITSALDAGDLGDAATHAVKGYGPEIYGYLLARLRDEDAAAETFSRWSEALWTSLERMAGRSSFRTWCYGIARNIMREYLRDPARRPQRNLPMEAVERASKLAVQVRTSTLPHLRTEVKDWVRSLRSKLKPDDQDLLTLHVDRDMSFGEIAEVLLSDEEPDADTLKRKEVALRKRYQRVRERLQRLIEASRDSRP